LNHLLEFKVALFPGSPPLLGKLGGFWKIFLPWSPIDDASQTATSLCPANNLTDREYLPTSRYRPTPGSFDMKTHIIFLQVTFDSGINM
jgi:hypothetical protein